MKRFPLGAVSVTPAAEAVIAGAGAALASLLARHAGGDWGEIDVRLWNLNTCAVEQGLPVFSSYWLDDGSSIRIATAGDRSWTSVTLPAEMPAQQVSTQEGYARWATLYDQEKNALIAVEQRAVDSMLAGHRYRSVLDAATGTGRHALNLARQGARVTAFDESEAMLDVAKRRAYDEALHIDLCLASLSVPLPFANERFDLVVCALVLCHLPDLTLPAREFARVLQPGGRILITDFHPGTVAYGWRTGFRDGVARYELPNYPHRRDDYLNAIEAAGFHIELVSDIPFGAVPPDCDPRNLRDELGTMHFCLLILADYRTPSS